MLHLSGNDIGDKRVFFWRFLPGVFFCWIIALVAPNGIVLYGLLIRIASPTYCVGASKALGHYPGGEGAGKQLGLILSLFMLVVMVSGVVLLMMLILSSRIEADTLVWLVGGMLLLLIGLFLFRFWPAYAAASYVLLLVRR